MIKRFSQIKNLGVFSDFRWSSNSELQEFQRFNLFYGLNGSGKTTLAKLFSGLNSGTVAEYGSAQYNVVSDNGDFTQGSKFLENIRVFDSDYVRSNIGEIEGEMNPIFIIGEENKKLVEEIEEEECCVEKRKSELAGLRPKKTKLENSKGKIFTDIARDISANTSGQATRSYRKPDAIKAYEDLDKVEILSVDEQAARSKVLNQQCLDPILELKIPVIEGEEPGKKLTLIDTAASLVESSQELLMKTAESIVIERFREKTDIAEWVEHGQKLHAEHDSSECEFCGAALKSERVEEIARHFSEADQELKAEIEDFLDLVGSRKQELEAAKLSPKEAFYEELKEEFVSKKEIYDEALADILSALSCIEKALEEKLQKRTEAEVRCFDLDLGIYSQAIKFINCVIQKHNTKSGNFKGRQSSAQDELENHYLSSINKKVVEADTEIATVDEKIKALTEGDPDGDIRSLAEMRDSIKGKRAMVSSSHKAAEELSRRLGIFLGRGDLQVESEGEGYRVLRGGYPAKNLSEGERTAITFIYFTVHLEDQDFDLENGIVVIDDPISSLDTGSIYQAFSFLKNTVKDAQQVFLLTHNFDFLKLLLNWLKNMPSERGRNKKSYYMLRCSSQGESKRIAVIEPLDKALLENESEYSYLFKILDQFESDGTIANSYHIPNIVRKVLEAFLQFMVPRDSMTLYRKLEGLDFDPQKKTALMKYANDLSHSTGKGFDPALVPETQNNVRHLFEMIETLAPGHYMTLMQSIES